MLKSFTSILLIITTQLNLYAQDSTNNKFGFSIDKPDKWLELSSASKIENLKEYAFSKETMLQLIKDQNNKITLHIYSKYDPKTHTGLCPTINISARLNPTEKHDDFMLFATLGAESVKKAVSDFEYISKPAWVTLNSSKAVYYAMKYSLTVKDFGTIKIKARSYSIADGKYFYLVNFMDSDIDDCSVLFDNLVKSISIKK